MCHPSLIPNMYTVAYIKEELIFKKVSNKVGLKDKEKEMLLFCTARF